LTGFLESKESKDKNEINEDGSPGISSNENLEMKKLK